jgi:uncharacterized caspase-like protein
MTRPRLLLAGLPIVLVAGGVLLLAAVSGSAPSEAEGPAPSAVEGPAPSAVEGPAQRAEAPIWMEIPELQARVEANGSAVIPHADISHFRLHIGRPGDTVNYGTIFTRINTEAANVIMNTTSTAGGIVCHFDLSLRAGFRFQRGRNSVEISYKDKWQRLHYSSFLIQTTDQMLASPSRTLTRAERATGEKFAVIVGISLYRNSAAGLTNLRFAHRDARAFRDFLTSPAGGSFRPENIRFLVNEDATSQNVRSALFTFLTKPGPEDLVVLFFAGHGAPDPNDPRNLYLITHDTNPEDMGGTAFPMWHLVDVFTRIIKARRVVTFSDTCHSFGISGATYGTRKQNNLVNQYLARFASHADRAVMTASDVSELSFESEQWGSGHGVFTHFVLTGLNGEADANQDGTVTAGELFPYVREQVQKATEGRQNPMALPGLAENLELSGIALRAAVPARQPGDAGGRSR